jgi:5-methyltetrahydrofolate--homocysteine methyltransferase
VGAEAKKLYDDAIAMMAEIVKTKSLWLKGIVGIYPANTVGYEDVEVYTDETRTSVAAKFCMLR